MRSLIAGAVLGCAFLHCVQAARAEGSAPPAPGSAPSAPASSVSLPLEPERGFYLHGFAALGYGRGLRLNNPFRLQTELGDDGQSLSLTAGYVDLGLGAAFGNPNGLQHGAVAHVSLAAQGVSQEVLSLSYVALYPLTRDLLGFARAGFPLVLEPDVGVGFELGAGATYFFSGGLGVSAELVSSLFFGAATWEHDPNIVPVLSLQLGAWVDYEVLP